MSTLKKPDWLTKVKPRKYPEEDLKPLGTGKYQNIQLLKAKAKKKNKEQSQLLWTLQFAILFFVITSI